MGGNGTATFSIGGYIGGSSGGAVGGVGASELIPSSSMLGFTSSNTGFSCNSNWEEFSERHARLAAADFAKACINFINGNLTPEQARNLSYRNFGQKFVDSFAEHYETEFFRRRANLKTDNGAIDESEYTEQLDSKISRKTFLRRFSFKGFRKGKALFHKNSDDFDGSNKNKTKLAKIVVECRKEGIVNNLTPESLDQPTGTQKWEKCRLALIKAVGGYMLEFYMPPKATKPRSGVFCFLISEARETTALEMPDRENTFVLKADNNMEYVIEAQDADDMRSWLATIRYCMRTPPTQQLTIESDALAATMQILPATNPNMALPHLAATPQQHKQNLLDSHENVVVAANSNSFPETTISALTAANSDSADALAEIATLTTDTQLPDIPPRRLGESGEQRLSSSSNVEVADVADSEPDINMSDITAEMRLYPWFHGTLPRSEAARMVLQAETNGHGFFLVRQSETRKGEFVLTFNFNGRAKHLRMTLSDKGQCRVQHLWFPSIQEMLEHFRHNPIPLESGGTSDVTLTEFIHNQGIPIIADDNVDTNDTAINATNIASGATLAGNNVIAEPSPRHPQDIISMNVSVRLKTSELDLSQLFGTGLVVYHQSQQPTIIKVNPQQHQHQQFQLHSYVNQLQQQQQPQQQQLPSSSIVTEQQNNDLLSNPIHTNAVNNTINSSMANTTANYDPVQQQQHLRTSTVSVTSHSLCANASNTISANRSLILNHNNNHSERNANERNLLAAVSTAVTPVSGSSIPPLTIIAVASLTTTITTTQTTTTTTATTATTTSTTTTTTTTNTNSTNCSFRAIDNQYSFV